VVRDATNLEARFVYRLRLFSKKYFSAIIIVVKLEEYFSPAKGCVNFRMTKFSWNTCVQNCNRSEPRCEEKYPGIFFRGTRGPFLTKQNQKNDS